MLIVCARSRKINLLTYCDSRKKGSCVALSGFLINISARFMVLLTSCKQEIW